MLFGRAKEFSRTDTLAQAEKARAKGKKAKAIAAYRKVLAHEPTDMVVHGKLAPLLAETNQGPDAWKSFELAATGQIEKGFVDRGIAIYHQATKYFPLSVDIWETIANLHLERGRKADSVKFLMEGQQHFHRRKQHWPTAITLLRRVLTLDECNISANVSLAQLLKRSGQKPEALALLDGLAPKLGGRGRKTVLKARFWVGPSLASLWRWFRG